METRFPLEYFYWMWKEELQPSSKVVTLRPTNWIDQVIDQVATNLAKSIEVFSNHVVVDAHLAEVVSNHAKVVSNLVDIVAHLAKVFEVFENLFEFVANIGDLHSSNFPIDNYYHNFEEGIVAYLAIRPMAYVGKHREPINFHPYL